MWRLWIILGLTLSACAEFPEVDAALSEGAARQDYPDLLPFEQVLSADDPRLAQGDDAALRARAADLRSRAPGLRRPVIDPETRDRMNDGVTEP